MKPLLLLVMLGGVARAEAGYELVKGDAPKLKVRQNAAVSLSLVPHAGHRLLADGPVLVRLWGYGVTPLRVLSHRDDAVDPRADVPRFELPLRADKPGPARLSAEITFYLCTAKKCRPVETSASWSLEILP